MKLAAYGSVSTLSATCAVLAAFRQRANFYAASVYLSKSNACMMILCNFGIFCTVILSKVLQSIFFGKLRSIELERLHDRLWFTVTETLLALAMFRDEFDTTFVVLFISLIFVKCFHWLASDRVEWMDQAATPPGRLFHARMISVLSLIWLTDMLLIAYATESVLLHGPSVVLMFEMEYIIMQVTCLSIICKYLLNSYGQYRAQEHWEAKSTYLFYIDLATDFLKLLTYIGFLSLTVTFYGLPINVLRDVYYTARSFISKCNNLVRFRQATRNMNERYPNATREEMDALADKTCIICREDMEFRDDNARRPVAPDNTDGGPVAGPNDTPKKLPCGHIFHFHCLRSWLERQQSCPTCRRPVLQTPAQNTARTTAAAAAAAAVGVQPAQAQAQGGAALIGPAAVPGGQQAGAGDGGLFGQPGNLFGGLPTPNANGMLNPQGRNDIQQRLREIQQRLANTAPGAGLYAAPAPQAGAGGGLRVPAGPQNGSPQNNPLVAFEIPNPPSQTSNTSLPSSHQAVSSSTAPLLPQASGSSQLGQAPSSSPVNLNSLNTPPPSDQETRNLAGHLQLSTRPENPGNFQPASCPSVGTNARPPSPPSNSHNEYTGYNPLKRSLISPGMSPPNAKMQTSRSFTDAPDGSSSQEFEFTPKVPRFANARPIAAATALGLPLPAQSLQSSGWDRLGVEERLSAAVPTTQDTPKPQAKSLQPTLADVELPCLIPLFDTETYTVPMSLRRAVERSRTDKERLVIDKTALVIPTTKFSMDEDGKEWIQKGVEEQLKVLMSVQQRLRECSVQLKRCLGVPEGAGGDSLDGIGDDGLGNDEKGKGKRVDR